MATVAMQAPVPLRPQLLKPAFCLPPQRPTTPNTYFKSPFNPYKHIAYRHGLRPKTHSLESLGLPESKISPIAVSEPFELFTKEAVQQMRNEVLSDEVWANCRYSSSLIACQLRGMAPKWAKFVYDAWTHPETLRIVSEIAGVELIPNMDYEIGHTNISVQPPEGNTDIPTKPVVGWHKDSYPFVCVVMLSDATEMEGGETALRTGTGEILKVRGPQMGSAVILQGRHIPHIGLPSTNCRERITMVTSFRPKDPSLSEDSGLMSVRPVSDLNELYHQWTEYRVELVEERCRRLVKKMRERKRVGRKFDIGGIKAEIEQLKVFLEKTGAEIVGGANKYEDNNDDDAEPERMSKRKKIE